MTTPATAAIHLDVLRGVLTTDAALIDMCGVPAGVSDSVCPEVVDDDVSSTLVPRCIGWWRYVLERS
jgi:hypothetical protein